MKFTENQKTRFYPGLVLSFLAIAGVSIFVLSSPFLPLIAYNVFQAIFIASAVYLVGIGYGIFNDLLATGHSLNYFTSGHGSGFEMQSKNRFAVSFTWGIFATWGLALPAAVLFGITALICNFVGLSGFSLFLPSMVGGALLCVLAADMFARYCKNIMMKRGDSREEAGYWSCNARNSFGYVSMPLLGLGGLITYTTLRALGISMPEISLPFYAQIAMVSVLATMFIASTFYLFHYRPSPHEVVQFSDNIEQIKMILSKTPDLSLKNSDGLNFLQLAVKSGKAEIVSMLLERSDIDLTVRDKDNVSLLHHAVFSKSQEMMIALLKKGCDPLAEDSYNRTPKLIASWLGITNFEALVDEHYRAPIKPDQKHSVESQSSPVVTNSVSTNSERATQYPYLHQGGGSFARHNDAGNFDSDSDSETSQNSRVISGSSSLGQGGL